MRVKNTTNPFFAIIPAPTVHVIWENKRHPDESQDLPPYTTGFLLL